MTTPTLDTLKKLVDGLLYVSDEDSAWQVWATTAKKPRVINANTFLGLTTHKWCTEENFENWFTHTIYSQGVSQGAGVRKRYEDLREGLIEMLYPRYVFRTDAGSPNKYMYYCVGVDFTHELVGCCVESVET